MTREALLKKLEATVDGAIRDRLYGKVEVEFRAGRPTFLRQLKEDKLDTETETRTYGNHNS